jgi:hypothetical protein
MFMTKFSTCNQGCTFNGFKDHNFLGEKKTFKGPTVLSNVPTFDYGTEVGGFVSYYCDCDMAYITCTPSDTFALVLYCDASGAQV